jgi:hypothetical protein
VIQSEILHNCLEQIQSIVTNVTIAEQKFAKHFLLQRIDEELSIAGQRLGKNIPAATNRCTNRWTFGGSDLFSVRPEL